MDKTQWPKIRQIFSHLSDQSPSFRTHYLDMVCENDTRLRTEVESMLNAHDELSREENGALLAGSDANELQPGTSIGDYVIKDVVGSGGMSIVYRASHPVYGDVAIKSLPRFVAEHPSARARLEREAGVLSSISHPALCGVHEILDTNDALALVLELIDGEDLDKYLTHKSLSPKHAVSIASDIASVLAVTHEQGIVHRDIKPSNVLITQAGHTKLIDFGIAHFSDARITYTGELLGSPGYMAPEQWNAGHIDTRTDIWSLGAMLQLMCCGAPAFTGSSIAEFADAVCHQPPGTWPDDRLQTESQVRTHKLVLKMLNKDPSLRPSSINSILKELDAIMKTD